MGNTQYRNSRRARSYTIPVVPPVPPPPLPFPVDDDNDEETKDSVIDKRYRIRANSSEPSALEINAALNQLLVVSETGNDTTLSFLFELYHELYPMLNNTHDFGGRAWTPLMLAAARGQGRIINMYLAIPNVQVNKESPDSWGMTALHLAVQLQQLSSVRTLTAHPRVDVNAKDGAGRTPLHLSIASHFHTATDVLLSRADIDITAVDAAGRNNCLHVAAMTGNLPALDAVIGHCCEKQFSLKLLVNVRNRAGLSVMAILQQRTTAAEVESIEKRCLAALQQALNPATPKSSNSSSNNARNGSRRQGNKPGL